MCLSALGNFFECDLQIAMTSGLLLIIVLVCKALGGWYFLAAQFCGFTAIIQLLHGTGVAVAVSMQKSMESGRSFQLGVATFRSSGMQKSTPRGIPFSAFAFISFRSGFHAAFRHRHQRHAIWCREQRAGQCFCVRQSNFTVATDI
jgi:hypothetical protein